MSNLEEVYIKRLMQVTTICLVIGALLGIIAYEFGLVGPERTNLKAQVNTNEIMFTQLRLASHYNIYMIYPQPNLHILVYDVAKNITLSNSTKNAAILSWCAAKNNTLIIFYNGVISLENPIIIYGSNVTLYALSNLDTSFIPTGDYNNYTYADPFIIHGKNVNINGLDASLFFRTFKVTYP